MVDSPSLHNDHRSSRSRSPSSGSRSSAVRNGTSHHHTSGSGNKDYSSSTRSKNYSMKDTIKIVQVANIAPQATLDQMQTLFGHVGNIDDIRFYPSVDIGLQVQSKICFVKFYDSSNVGVAQHLTNTVFIDRALIVIPYLDGDIPDETCALELLASGSLLPGIADPKLPQHVTSQLEGIVPLQVVVTKDPRLIERNLPSYPPLPPTVDSRKIEEIRRTIMVYNISHDLTSPDLMSLFSKVGEVKYFRFCTRDNDPLKYALIEFSEQTSILEAMQLNGQYIGDNMIRVYHATQAIIKPQAKTNEAAQKEIEEAMARQAQDLLTHGLDAKVAPSVKEKRRSRTISRSHGRRSRSRGRRSRTRCRRRYSSRSRRSSSRRRDRYRSKAGKRSRSRDKRRSRSRKRSKSRGRSRRSRSHSPSKRSWSRSRKREDRKKSKKDKDREKDREKDRHIGSDHHKENGEDASYSQKEKRLDRRSRSPTAEFKKRGRSRSSSGKPRSPSSDEKERSAKNKKKKNDSNDHEHSVNSDDQSRDSSQEKRSRDCYGDLEYDDKSDVSRNGNLDDAGIMA